MIIETKYNINDEVWLIWKTEVVKDKIEHIYFDTKSNEITYELINSKTNVFMGVELKAEVEESKIFKTKEELIASL
jgi:hypothetical protein